MTIPAKPLTAAVLIAHPRTRSFTEAMAASFVSAFTDAGGHCVVRDLYKVGFDPLLHANEIPDHDGFGPRADVIEERRLIGDANVFALFYPLWYNAPPAIMMGYVARVFGMGFAYTSVEAGGNQPLLTGRRLVSFTSSGAPQSWVESSGAWDAMNRNFDAHFAAVAGLRLAGHHNVGGVNPGMREDVVARHRIEVEAAARRLVTEPDGVSV